jgi:hypothetical protein
MANEPEHKLARLAERNGWTPTKRGWPDFLCFGPDGEVIAVEVKPRDAAGQLKRLKVDQANAMDWLQAHGIRCYVSDGDTLEKYNRAKHRDRATLRATG